MLWASSHEFYLLISKTRQKPAVIRDRQGWATFFEAQCHEDFSLDFSVLSWIHQTLLSALFLGTWTSSTQATREVQPFVGLANINDGHKAVEIDMLRGIIACLTDLSALIQDQTNWTSNTDNLHGDN